MAYRRWLDVMNITRISRTVTSLGRGVAVGSALAVLGVTSLSVADASAAGVATGVRHVTAGAEPAAASPTNLGLTTSSRHVVRDGGLVIE